MVSVAEGLAADRAGVPLLLLVHHRLMLPQLPARVEGRATGARELLGHALVYPAWDGDRSSMRRHFGYVGFSPVDVLLQSVSPGKDLAAVLTNMAFLGLQASVDLWRLGVVPMYVGLMFTEMPGGTENLWRDRFNREQRGQQRGEVPVHSSCTCVLCPPRDIS